MPAPASSGPSRTRTLLLTAVTLVAFAANSVLCRMALGADRIDPASFTLVRLLAGALTLGLVTAGRLRSPAARSAPPAVRAAGWGAPFFLFLYAACFSFAYVGLTAGTGALILFGAVQMTMIGAGLAAGERPRRVEWIGLAAALGGLVYLVSPGLAAPPPAGAALMAAAGVSWGMYSLRGRGSGDPIAATTGNFVRSLPFALLISVALAARIAAEPAGLALAALSGAVASGLGYVLWYAALRGLTATRAAIVQLAVPVLAALGGVVFLAEPITPRLAISAVVVLGGVALAIVARSPRPAPRLRGAAASAAGDATGGGTRDA